MAAARASSASEALGAARLALMRADAAGGAPEELVGRPEAVLAHAREVHGSYFVVPRVVDE